MRDHLPNFMSEYLEIEDRIAEAMEWEQGDHQTDTNKQFVCLIT